MDGRGAPPPPCLDVNKRCLLPPRRLAREIGFVLAPKHAIRLDHPLAFRARVLVLQASLGGGSLSDHRGPPSTSRFLPASVGDFGPGGFVVRFGK